MAQQTASKNYWTFNRGLITEASALTFPENASLDEENFELRVDGSRKRRKGLKKESSTSFAPASDYYSSSYAFNTFEWNNPGAVNGLTFVVQQSGRYVHFFTMGTTYSGAEKSFSIDLDTYKVTGATTANVEQSDIDATSGKGKLIVVGKYIEPLLVVYDSTSDDIGVYPLIIKERDFIGQNDSLDIDTRPSTLSSEHEYNLKNQGWTQTNITAWDTARTDFPSNADIEFLGYDSSRSFSAARVVTYATNTPAPKGHFISRVFQPGYVENYADIVSNSSFTPQTSSNGAVTVTVTTASAHGFTAGNTVTLSNTRYVIALQTYTYDGSYTILSTPLATTYTISARRKLKSSGGVAKAGFSTSIIPFDLGITEAYRPTSTAFFAGRVFYAGTESARINDVIHFTPIIEYGENEEFEECYQEADPTAEESNELIATDGGSIRISGMGQVKKMVPIGVHLVIFTDRGVWAVGPGDDGFFKATSFTVRNIANVGCSSKQSVVIVEGIPIFWSPSGIYSLQEDKVTGYLTAQSLSGNTIQTFYNELGATAIASAKGVYDDLSKRIYWLYKDSDGNYLRVLGLDIRLNAFFKWRLYNTGNTNAKPVTISAALGAVSESSKVKICYRDVVGTSIYYWANFDDTTFKDFEVTDAAAYLVTGYELLEDARKPKFTGYVHCFLERTETGFVADGLGGITPTNPSSCTLQARWDWANSSNGGKFSSSQEVYRYRRLYIPSGVADTFDTGDEVIVTKNRVRGTGKALHLKYSTTALKDCRLIGWTVGYAAGSAE